MSNESEVLKKIKELVDEVYSLKLETSVLEKKYNEKKNELAKIMEESEVDKMAGDDCTASLTLKSSVTVPKDESDKRALFDYIKTNHGEDALFSMLTINARTFSSWHDKEVEAKANEGDFEFKLSMLKPYEYFSVGLRKRSKKAGK